MLLPINEMGAVGLVTEIPPHELPFNAWSMGRNVRFRNGFAEKFLGEEVVFDPPTIGAYYLVPVFSGSTYYWLQLGLTKASVWNGTLHTDITNAGGDYSATALAGWTGCVLGGVPVLNNGVNPPQMWLPQSIAQPLQNLSNWPANTVCGAMRAYRNHLVAMDVTKNGTRYPQMVKTSHPAANLTVPSSWDETDETKDAWEYEFMSSNGALVDGERLRSLFAVYKEDSVHALQYVGPPKVFAVLPLFDNFGILSRKCAVEFTAGRHAVFALGDIIVHDGQSWESIVSRTMRDWVFKQMNPAAYLTSFVQHIPQRFEVWFCFPSAGYSLPNIALVWNWKENTLGVRDLPGVPYFAIGAVNPGVTEVWDDDSNAWQTDTTVWDEALYNPSGLRVLGARPETPQLLYMDRTNSFRGTAFQSYLERTGLAFPVTNDGPPDMNYRKMVRRLWPRIEGTDGGVVKVTLGTQNKIDGPVTWGVTRNYTIGSTEKLDFLMNGRLFAWKFESDTDIYWRLLGCQVDVVNTGQF